MQFTLTIIRICFHGNARLPVYELAGPGGERIVISALPGESHCFDLAYSPQVAEDIADRLFHVFMDALDGLREAGQKPSLGQVFTVSCN